ncbi:M48 family metallopeptidase [Chroococcidiopsis sp. CCNUC1]|uniref:M48 family metallopeptidase n=1 Tax=Chroococcidiopsis sp. CCNUC1 TaxID=2653189 RepID=UPI00201FC60A|nr:M48 family metalloprotease [Chroococcidiopsis sp. CCNUC1]URD52664.1 M48 family metalloprotease [Chroococcidiopsis sp. CCNUC1]
MAMTGDPEMLLEATKTALQQEDYQGAIAHLEILCQTENISIAEQQTQPATSSSNIKYLLSLCRLLAQSSNLQIEELREFLSRRAEETMRLGAEGAILATSHQSPATFLQFKQAPRAQRWQPLPTINLIPFWLLQCGSAIALFWSIQQLIELAMGLTNDLLVKLPYLEPFQPFYHDHTTKIVFVLVLLLALSPWLIDGLLRWWHGLQHLSLETLAISSPEASRLLQRSCRQHHCRLPQLRLLPTTVPLIFTYGNLRRTARIVVSQGLLEQLADDEIAAIYATQLGQIANWDFIVLSQFILVTQLPYITYSQLSQWGNKISNKTLQAFIAIAANFAYGLWLLLRLPTFWLSQLRIYYSDRLAAELTGNPNALSRAILKIARGVAQDIQQQGHTSWLLEGWDLLAIISYKQAISLSNLHSLPELEAALAWDCTNPLRYWLSINQAHPSMGDRLQRLNQIAHFWRLDTELNLRMSRESGVGSRWGTRGTRKLEENDRAPHPTPFFLHDSLLLQVSPYLGVLLGAAFSSFMWLIGWLGGYWLGNPYLAWMWGDWWIVRGSLAIGLSLGIFLRLNALFPETKSTSLLNRPNLAELLSNPDLLPVVPQPLRLQGKLLGRRGIGNWFGQDLLLHLPTGLVKLHHASWLGPLGCLLLRPSTDPTDLIGRHVILTGWFRRGATAWIDIEILRTQAGKTSTSSHQAWSIALAIAATIWGVYVIVKGGSY